MVKMKGFTLIEIMIVIAIVAILIMVVSAGLSNCKKKKAKLNNSETIEEMIDIDEIINGTPIEYIRNDRRNSGDFKLIRHDDGTLWGCIVESGNCYKVTE